MGEANRPRAISPATSAVEALGDGSEPATAELQLPKGSIMEHAIIWPLPGDGEETQVRLFATDEEAVMWAGDNLPTGGWQYARVVPVSDAVRA